MYLLVAFALMCVCFSLFFLQVMTPWQQTCAVWQERMRKMFPLTAVKIVVVVWQIVTQVWHITVDAVRIVCHLLAICGP